MKRPSVRIAFDFQLFSEEHELLTEGHTSLVFIDMKQNKPTKAPPYITEKTDPLFS